MKTRSITHPSSNGTEILGFVGRRHPDVTDDRNPKYLNTGTTPLFNKGGQLFGAIEPLLAAGATPVVVEGPMDAIAVTLATGAAQVGVSPLGTALTEDQVAQLARQFQRTGRDPVVATDGDRDPSLIGYGVCGLDRVRAAPRQLDAHVGTGRTDPGGQRGPLLGGLAAARDRVDERGERAHQISTPGLRMPAGSSAVLAARNTSTPTSPISWW